MTQREIITLVSLCFFYIMFLLKDLKAVFKMFDKDGSGAISAGELGDALNNMGLKVTNNQAKELLAKVDKDRKCEKQLSTFVCSSTY